MHCLCLVFTLLFHQIVSKKHVEIIRTNSDQYAAHFYDLENVPTAQSYYVLINAKQLFWTNVTNFYIQPLKPHNRYSINIYTIDKKSKHLHAIDHSTFDISDNIPARHNHTTKSINIIDYNKPYAELLTPRISTYYSTLNAFEAQEFQNITHNIKYLQSINKSVINVNNNVAPNVETLLKYQNVTKLTFYDLIQQWAWTTNSNDSNIYPVLQSRAGSFYHDEPDLKNLSYYCVYKNDPNNHEFEQYIIPDCQNVSDILAEHAKMLTSSGFDFIAIDLTNLVNDDSQGYILQIRPTQIMFEEWYNLRENSNIDTPDIVAWNPAKGVEWKQYLQVYNKYPSMVLKANVTDDINNTSVTTEKMVYFVLLNPNQTIVDKIASNGGGNNITVVTMWGGGGLNPKLIGNGTWTFMYTCRAESQGLQQTTSLENITECNLIQSNGSSIGTEMSPTFSFQHTYASLTFASPSKLNGRTFQLMMNDVLINKPENVMISTFNEHTAGGTSLNDNYTWSDGMGFDTSHNNERSNYIFVDSYGCERGRSFESTIECGDYYWRLAQSCIRVMRLKYFFETDDNKNKNENNVANVVEIKNKRNKNTGVLEAACNVENELCCNNFEMYYDIYSIKNNITNDSIVTNDWNEFNNLVNKPNSGYYQICTSLSESGTTSFCINSKYLDTYYHFMGPFVVYQKNESIYGSIPNTMIKRVAIYRCVVNQSNGSSNVSYHFIASNQECDGINGAVYEKFLGYVASEPSSAMPRRLLRCKSLQYGYYYHVLDNTCQFDGDFQMSLGYVL